MLYRFSVPVSFILVGCAAAFLGASLYLTHNKCIDLTVLENYDPGLPSLVLDDEGNEWTRFQFDKREPIPLSQMPEHLLLAFIAAEDRSFFSHYGISIKGMIRSLLVNIYHGRIVQGASTITQQLVKLLFFDSQKTIRRKIKEQVVALIVEQQFTKEQILETYLNHIYFGCGIYGVQAASQRFWSKPATALTIDESALLAAIVRSPGRYCPIIAPLSAEKRRNVVLRSMKEAGFITQEQYRQAIKMPLVIHPEPSIIAPHFKESLRLFLENQFGKTALYTGGLIVQTTLNKKIQQAAQQTFTEQCALLKTTISPEIDGGLITMDVKTGEIKALIGGYNFKQSQRNRALQARRQIGSGFKPLIYAAALQNGMHFYDTALDEPIEIVRGTTIWRPKNANANFGGQMTLAHALSHSNNIIAIKTLLAIGYEPVIALAQKTHIKGPCYPYPSLALGCVDATVKEMVGMFNIFANDGIYVEPHMVAWIKNRWGTKIWKYTQIQHRVISSSIASQVAKILEHGLERVHKYFPQPWLNCKAISKTGTTNDSRTCWYTGSTPDYTTSIYLGCDDNRALGKDVFPLTTAFPIWLAISRSLPIEHAQFIYDPSLQELVIHEKTGIKVANLQEPGAIAILTP